MTKILVMEDNAAIRETFQVILETAGYEVYLSSNGIEGSVILEHEVIDLIVSNGEMPQMNGYEAVQVFKNNPLTAHIPFLIITASEPTEPDQRKALQLANAHLSKPIAAKDLLNCVATLLQQ